MRKRGSYKRGEKNPKKGGRKRETVVGEQEPLYSPTIGGKLKKKKKRGGKGDKIYGISTLSAKIKRAKEKGKDGCLLCTSRRGKGKEKKKKEKAGNYRTGLSLRDRKENGGEKKELIL